MSEGRAYVGSKISLISKSEIRYEGILYTIDPKEATVALAKVRTFGTEDRFTDKPIASRDDIYEYVIFRGKDIKDIKVCEPPQPQALIGGLPNDPAIVEAYQSQESRKQSFSPTGSFQSSDYGGGGVSFGFSSTQPYAPHGGSRPTTPTTMPKRRSPTMDQGVQVSVQPEKRDLRKPQTQPQIQMQQRPFQSVNQHQQPQQSQQRQMQMAQQNRQGSRGARRGGRGGGRGGSSSAIGGGGGGGPGGGNRGAFNKVKEQLKFEGEYDFEQANAEFQEMESKLAKTKISDTVQNGTATEDKKDDSGTETTVGEIEDDSAVTYYDKSKSFFDSISCEALERSKGKFQRTDWRQERKLNVETFGVVNSFMRRGGYRGRGYRGRGGFRGGRSRGFGRGGGAQGNQIGGDNSARTNSQVRKSTQDWGNQKA